MQLIFLTKTTSKLVNAFSIPFVLNPCCLQGDPSAAPYAVENAKAILGQKPVFGICMGHQVLGQAFGGKTFKLLFGHHGGNHPIRDVATGKVQISAQNHNFAVDADTLPEGVIVSHVNLNDGVLLQKTKNPIASFFKSRRLS